MNDKINWPEKSAEGKPSPAEIKDMATCAKMFADALIEMLSDIERHAAWSDSSTMHALVTRAHEALDQYRENPRENTLIQNLVNVTKEEVIPMYKSIIEFARDKAGDWNDPDKVTKSFANRLERAQGALGTFERLTRSNTKNSST